MLLIICHNNGGTNNANTHTSLYGTGVQPTGSLALYNDPPKDAKQPTLIDEHKHDVETRFRPSIMLYMIITIMTFKNI